MKKFNPLLLVTVLATAVYGYILWLYFGVINSYFSEYKIFYVKQFRAEDGHKLILGLFVSIALFTLVYLLYAYYDHKTIKMYGIDTYDYAEKNNFYSTARIIQYVILGSGLFYFGGLSYRAFNIHETMAMADLMSTMAIIIMYEFQLVYFAILNVMLCVEVYKYYRDKYL